MGRKLALFIANSVYDDTTLSRLVTPEADVDALAKVFRDPDIGGFDEIEPLKDESTRTIMVAMARFFAKKKRDDLLLLYFSGHGILDSRGGLYLAGRDTDHELISATAIPSTFINDHMVESSSKQKVLILDCCYSGAFTRGTKGQAGKAINTATRFNGRGQVVLTATDATQYAWEGDAVIGEAQRSVFTRHLVQGLETGEADSDNDGWITLDEWYNYVYEQVTKETSKQTPGKWANQQGWLPPIAKSRLPILEGTSRTSPVNLKLNGAKVLWVDDNPFNIGYPKNALEVLGIQFTMSTSTEEALEKIHRQKYDVIISDMGRPPDMQAGYTLLQELQKLGINIPFIICSSSDRPEHRAEAARRGAFGSTNHSQELFNLVISALVK